MAYSVGMITPFKIEGAKKMAREYRSALCEAKRTGGSKKEDQMFLELASLIPPSGNREGVAETMRLAIGFVIVGTGEE